MTNTPLNPDDLIRSATNVVLETAPLQKCCGTRCGKEFPLTEEYWYRDSHSRTGFRKRCKACQDAYRDRRQDRAQKAINLRVRSLDHRMMVHIGQQLTSSRGSEGVPHLARFIEIGLGLHGGLEEFMARMFADRSVAAPGSKIRLDYDRIMCDCIKTLTMQGQVKMPLDLLSDEDLEREKRETLKLVYGPTAASPPAGDDQSREAV